MIQVDNGGGEGGGVSLPFHKTNLRNPATHRYPLGEIIDSPLKNCGYHLWLITNQK